ncbi:MAG: hypothetical protein JXQ27_15055 [Acidobacteria bacterium]|nr:hypothetical protein [Acidobacteriota bacterium]
MAQRIMFASFFLLISLCLIACGGGNSPQPPAETPAAASPVTETLSTPSAPESKGLTKISDMLDAWNTLYDQNEAVINDYEGMPIMELVTPAATFIGSVQFDILNLDNKDGQYSGTLPLAGYKGQMEKSGSMITFGWDHTMEKDGFGPLAKKGDHLLENGFLDLDKEYYREERTTDRAGQRIARSYNEFKRLADGSMICLVFNGQAMDARGNAATSDSVIYLHNGPGRYDFVIAKGTTGPGFTPFSFAEKGDLTKDQAIELFRNAGYTIDKTGGIKDGKLVLDK